MPHHLMQYVNYNGAFYPAGQACIPALAPPVHTGAGLVETMLFTEGRMPLAVYHWERLFSGMSALQFPVQPGFTPEMLNGAVADCVRRNGLDACCKVRLQVFPGSGLTEYIITCFPAEKPGTEMAAEGLHIGIASGLAKSADSLAGLKSLAGSLLYAGAAKQAAAAGLDDMLIRNTEGRLIESSICNLFWVEKDRIFTPPLSDGCVAGVMRRFLIGKAEAAGLQVAETSLDPDRLQQADELWLTNAVRNIRWVAFAGKKKMTRELASELYRLCLFA